MPLIAVVAIALLVCAAIFLPVVGVARKYVHMSQVSSFWALCAAIPAEREFQRALQYFRVRGGRVYRVHEIEECAWGMSDHEWTHTALEADGFEEDEQPRLKVEIRPKKGKKRVRK